MQSSFITLKIEGSFALVECVGIWRVKNSHEIEKSLAKLHLPKSVTSVLLNFSSVESFDTAGVLLFLELKRSILSKGLEISQLQLSKRQEGMLSLVKEQESSISQESPKKSKNPFAKIGKRVVFEIQSSLKLFDFLGRFILATLRLLLKPSLFRFKETIYHIEKSGFDSLFIIAITSILIGLVVAYQSIVQLAQFGADIFVVDAIGISITRELGPMITAIVIAGRSASSYTAEIGTMKLTEEINAMKTMGFDPLYFLVIPRVFALMISIPLVIFFADITGIFGGMLATKAEADISFYFFINRLQEVLDVSHYILGLIKGPFFAIIIAVTGSYHGFRVTNNTESIGIETTKSVVHAIFFVIACDALFSIIYTELGL
jgi:phospholipid/cholesterol/gamma-HCH transport system permease protein